MSAILPYTPDSAEEAKQRTQEWLRGIYKNELDRDIGDEGLKYWTEDIHDRGQSKEDVLSNIRKSNEKWLVDTYKTELDRPIDDEGREYWMGDLRGKGSGKEDLTYGSDRDAQTREQVLANIKRSTEFKEKEKEKEIIPLPIVCGSGEQLNSAGTGCVSIPKPKPKPKVENPRYKPDPRYTPNPNRPYNKYWDAIDSAADTGNRMTDDYYQRFLPQMRKEVMLGIDEMGAADRYHGSRYEGTPPDYIDPADLFKKYRGDDSDSSDDDDSSDTVSSLSKRLAELEKKYSINS
jgi:predicted RNase H-like HicB family nuclease